MKPDTISIIISGFTDTLQTQLLKNLLHLPDLINIRTTMQFK